ncbi:MAG: hypothetical protein OXR07_00630 [Nitrospira sp.]|nr:hypothetical protein [Nitrospira sp.]MDD9860637.1 hypothetical protein [Nitrospira sp.]
MVTPGILKRLVRDRKGFTLLEAVIAMGMVFLAILALSGLAVTASKGAAASRHLTTAVNLAQDSLETLHRGGYDAGSSKPTEITDAYDTIPDLPRYKRVLRLEPHRPVPGLHTATVTVWWAEDRQSVSFSTILAP